MSARRRNASMRGRSMRVVRRVDDELLDSERPKSSERIMIASYEALERASCNGNCTDRKQVQPKRSAEAFSRSVQPKRQDLSFLRFGDRRSAVCNAGKAAENRPENYSRSDTEHREHLSMFSGQAIDDASWLWWHRGYHRGFIVCAHTAISPNSERCCRAKAPNMLGATREATSGELVLLCIFAWLQC
eukprot:1190443-Prorocentrum_minimum.AAC.2